MSARAARVTIRWPSWSDEFIERMVRACDEHDNLNPGKVIDRSAIALACGKLMLTAARYYVGTTETTKIKF